MYNEIMNEVQVMEQALKQLGIRGKAYAEAERDYKIAMRSEILRLRDEGKPATLILQLCYGTPSIAKLRLERDIAETMYKSALEAINVKKLKIRIMENQYDKEWGNTN
jgi:hypothetical protein